MQHASHPRTLVFLSLSLLLLIINTPITSAQDSQQKLTGWISTVFGDPPAGSGLPPQYHIFLTDDTGSLLAELHMDSSQAQALVGQRVTVTGQLEAQGSGTALGVTPLQVDSLQPLSATSEVSAQALTGSQRWINVLCKFPDVSAEPHQPADYSVLFSNTYPGLDDYFRKLSYDSINLVGTVTTSHWYNLPYPLAHYTGASTNLTALAQDCAAAANADIYFPTYSGINFMYNESIGCCAWGGSQPLSIDGQYHIYRATWLSPWAQSYGAEAHEMGHAFGFPHSTGPSTNPPSGSSVQVSYWDIMSFGGGTCIIRDEVFYTSPLCIPQSTIAYHRDLDGWIPAQRRVIVTPNHKATVTLEQLQDPGQNTNALIVRIPIAGTSTLFYTVEARTLSGYDQNLPAAAVIIHLVNTTRSLQDGQALVVDADGNNDVNDAGAQWLPGETFLDAARNISIEVLSSTATSFTVRVKNNPLPDPADAAPVLNVIPEGTYTLTWSPVSWAAGYEVQVSTTSGFTIPLFAGDDALSSNQLSFDLAGIPDGVYYWRVRAKQANGTWGSWSAIQSFEVSRPG